MTKESVQGLLYYYENSADLDEGIRVQTVEVLNEVIAKMEEEAAILAKKRKSPNKSGIVCVDAETGKVVAEYATQKEALIAIGKDPKKSGISDAINGRTSTHMAYGYKWFFKDEFKA
jgi:glucose dehydrogenase